MFSDIRIKSKVLILYVGISVNVGYNATVFQSEIKAIEICANECLNRGTVNSNILICSDSQAVLKALCKNKINSKTVLECLLNCNV